MPAFFLKSPLAPRAVVLALVLGSVCPLAALAAVPSQASGPLQLADLGEIAQWQKGGAETVFVEDKSGHWYRVDLQETCMNLDTSKGISFLTEENTDSPGRHSMVEIAHRQCQVSAVVPIAAPPQR